MAKETGKKASVALVKTNDRVAGIKKAIGLLNINPVQSQDVFLKPNFNTADPFPASTHIDTLRTLVLEFKRMGAKSIIIGDRSGPADTAQVFEEKGVNKLAKELGFKTVNFEDLPADQWVRMKPEKSHWKNGFEFVKPVLDSKCVVTTCCLKTHAYGGIFTMSLKNSIGMVRKKNMPELHESPYQRKMIAEVNQTYSPALILMDGMECFVDFGPMTGPKKRADVILAGTDRIAIDCTGLAILKELGSNKAIMNTKIFQQEQIARAVELGLGIKSPDEIELITGDAESQSYAETIKTILSRG